MIDPAGLELRAWAPEVRYKLGAPLPPGLGNLDRRTREAVNEVRFGDVKMLKFLLARPSAPPPPSPLDPATILVPNQVDAAGLFALAAVLDTAATETRRAELQLAMVVPGPPGEAPRAVRGRQPLSFEVQPGPQNAFLAVMVRLIDGHRDVQTLVARAWAGAGVPGSALTPEMRDKLARARPVLRRRLRPGGPRHAQGRRRPAGDVRANLDPGLAEGPRTRERIQTQDSPRVRRDEVRA